tara:strand:+ start:3237 stop:3449 length:213 start_codon:yes stop_codon:yes gene_type:complete
MEENIINQKFYDIINQENWDETDFNFDPTIRTEIISQQEVPLGNVMLPTPIPGIWISLDIGFNIEGQEDG